MKMYPELTWEWLLNFHDQFINMEKSIRVIPTPQVSERIKKRLVLKEKLNSVVIKMRDHPQLKYYVPMKSLNYLRWFPAAGLEIQLDVERDTNDYLIIVATYHGPLNYETNEEKIVDLEDVADEVYAYITKLRDD
jgi:hypothetical protein